MTKPEHLEHLAGLHRLEGFPTNEDSEVRVVIRYFADRGVVFIATGLRRSELLGQRWIDYSDSAGTITVTGKVVRVAGKGLLRVAETKTAAGRRTLKLPRWAVDMLRARRGRPYLGEQTMIFPSTAGTWRDPSNFSRQ